MNLRFIGAAAAALTLALTVAAAAKLLPNVTDQPSRFSGPGIYTGAPDLPVTLSMIVAGGGPQNFQTTTLVGVLAGSKANAEVASLTSKFGATKVGNFVKVFNFVVADSLKIVNEKHVMLPSTPKPDPKDVEITEVSANKLA